VWVSAKEAVELVEEPGVVPLLHGLTEFEDVAEVRRATEDLAGS